MKRLLQADRLDRAGNTLRLRPVSSTTFPSTPIDNIWTDTRTGSFADDKVYVVQTSAKVVERCILMTTDPGDLVLDPTCGSGTTAYVAEQWGRRWITIDTSRVALALARARHHGRALSLLPARRLAARASARKPRSPARAPADTPTHGDIRQGFVYERVPHITLKSIANNAEIDVIWEKWQADAGAAAREAERGARSKTWEEWEIPREADAKWPDAAQEAARRLVGGADRPAEGDRRLDRRQGRVRVPLRQALRGQEEGPRRRAVHGREPVAAPRARRATRTTS